MPDHPDPEGRVNCRISTLTPQAVREQPRPNIPYTQSANVEYEYPSASRPMTKEEQEAMRQAFNGCGDPWWYGGT